MEALGIFGLIGFVMAARLYTDLKKVKKQISEINVKLATLQDKQGA